jgi:glycosyltransferase involved in cell wall biosynthesis
MTPVGSPAFVTAIYPGVEPYLKAWYASIAQWGEGLPLWIVLDQISPAAVSDAIGREPAARWVSVPPGAGIGAVRQAGIDAALKEHDAILFIDCDDELCRGRVERSVAALSTGDVVACHMTVIDEHGHPAGVDFGPAADADVESAIVRVNAFGLSNTAYRADLLSTLLPIPPSCDLVDWYLATVAWGAGARLTVDSHPGMKYRQYGRNVARVLPPFTREQVVTATVRVDDHYSRVLGRVTDVAARGKLTAAQVRIQRFRRWLADALAAERYIDALNRLPGPHLWWALVAHPQLEDLWNRS